jgi:hypothetical protein
MKRDAPAGLHDTRLVATNASGACGRCSLSLSEMAVDRPANVDEQDVGDEWQ